MKNLVALHRPLAATLGTLLLLVALSASAARIKDIAYVQGVRDNQLLGYGLVVGLDGSGDFGQAAFTVQSTASMLSRLGISVDASQMQTRNVAAVMVLADLPPFARSGQRLDITVASLGNARSLQGGTLVMTPLLGPDGQVYAMAQGSLSVGGYDVQGGAGTSRSQNHVNVGRVPEGALVERNVDVALGSTTTIRLILQDADFTTAVNIARRVSRAFDPSVPASGGELMPFQGIAEATDASTVTIEIPEVFRDSVPQFISLIEELEVQRDSVARVVINERTGTVVLSGHVSMSQVAVSHGNLNVSIDTRFDVSQPSLLAERGDTRVVPQVDLEVSEDTGTLQLVDGGETINDVVAALNAFGTSPRDLISILQAIDSAGALHAELVIQ